MLGSAVLTVTLAAMLALMPGLSASAQSYDAQFKTCFEGKDPQQRIQACTAVINANREPPAKMAKVYFARGLSFRRSGQNDRALQDYNQSLQLDQQNSNTLNSRCYLFAITDRLQDALKDCNKALQLDPKNQYAYDSRGFTYLKLGMLDASIADYTAAINLEPNRPYSMFGRGVARARKGDVAGGQADMAAAKQRVPGIAEEFARYGVKVP